MKILFTRKIPNDILAELNFNQEDYEIVMWEEENVPMPRELLLEQAKDAHAIYTNVADQIDKELFDVAKNLKVVATMGVGFDNIDVEEATKRNIPIGHTPGVLTEAVADLTFTLLMATSRRVVEGMEVIKKGEWQSWGPFLLVGQKIYGATIGIIGMGRIGEAVAKRAKGFGMNILYHNRSRKLEAEKELGASYVELEELLKESDYVVLLAPSSKETYHMISHKELSHMKPSSIFINASRGANVDEEALYEALKEKKIFGAGLDVFEEEPISADHPLLTLDNVIALPHIGSANMETRKEMTEITLNNIICGLEEKELVHTANPEVYVQN